MSFEWIIPFLRLTEPLLLGESAGGIIGNPAASWFSERNGIHFLLRRQALHRA